MTCFDIYGLNNYVSIHKYNSFEKNTWYSYDFLMIFVEIFHDFGWLFATRIRFIEADPDPADQNETDPNGSGSATLLKTLDFLLLIWFLTSAYSAALQEAAGWSLLALYRQRLG